MKKTGLANVQNTSPTGVVFLKANGVVVPGRGSWRAIHDIMDTRSDGAEHYRMFSRGEISFEEWCHHDAELWAGRSVKPIREAAKQLETVDGLDQAIKSLHELGFRVGIVSCGVHQYIQNVAEESGVDFVVANNFEVKDAKLTGHVHIQVTVDSWGEHIKDLAEDYSIPLKRTVAVGASVYDIKKFKSAGFSIAFNPANDNVAGMADVVLPDRNLRNIVPPIWDWLDKYD